MKLFARTKPVSAPERRSGPRTRVDCLATFLMPSGNRHGRLFDISTAGARVVTQNPPPKGASAILEWNLHEAYCHIIWTKPGMCGVQFDRPVPQRVIDELVEQRGAGPRLVHPAPSDGDGSEMRPPTRFVS